MFSIYKEALPWLGRQARKSLDFIPSRLAKTASPKVNFQQKPIKNRVHILVLFSMYVMGLSICTYWLIDRQGRYWHIANPKFLFAWNRIKIRWIIIFYFLFRNLFQKIAMIQYWASIKHFLCKKFSVLLKIWPQFCDNSLKQT